MNGFTSIFGGSNITPTQPSFLSINPLTTNIVLGWPLEQTGFGPDIAADIIEVNATSGGLTIQLSDARQVSTGYTLLFNNIGTNTFTVLDSTGAVIVAVASGTVWQIYLADNSTAAGTWRLFQYGAGASSANAAALAGAGLVAASTKLNETIVVSAKNANYVSVGTDLATCLEWTGGTGTITLPNAATVGTNWFVLIKNNGTGVVTVSPPSGTIDLLANLAFDPDQSAIVVCDGTNYFTVGFGQQLNSIFDFDIIDVSGSGDFVLVGVNLNRVSYRFIGVLTGNRNIIVPNTVQQYWVDNETTGAFGLTVKTAAGTGTSVNQGARNILYCDGTNVVAAVTFNSTGFADGSAAAPSIAFASHPTTGFYLAGADVLGFTTAGVERGQADNQGHWIFEAPSAAGVAVTINGFVGSITELIQTAFGQTSASPGLVVKSTAAGGFSFLSIVGNNGTPGTNDLSIFQNGATGESQVLNRHATGHLKLGANSIVGIDINQAGIPNHPLGLSAPATAGPVFFSALDATSGFGFGGVGPQISIGTTLPSGFFTFGADINSFCVVTASHAIRLSSGSNPLYVDNHIQVDNAGAGGTTGLSVTATSVATATAGAATLPANPLGFLTWNLNGTTVKVPYYSN
jgi:hypothetical protein